MNAKALKTILKNYTYLLVISTALVSSPGFLVHATEGGADSEDTVIRSQNETSLTDRDTGTITADITSSASQCLSLPKEYRVDCLAQELKEASRLVRKSGYREANREIKSAAQKLDRLVKQNEDKSAPKLKRGGKTYRAVKKSAVAKVNKKAAKIIAETSTKLIRSAGNSKRKKVHYTRIAKAVNSTKVLLRSA